MTNARTARQLLLDNAEEIIQKYMDYSLGKLYDFQGDPKALEVLFKTVIPVVKLDDDTLNIKNKNVGDTRESMIKAITNEMMLGLMSPAQANQAIEAIRNGMDIIEVESMIDDIKSGISERIG